MTVIDQLKISDNKIKASQAQYYLDIFFLEMRVAIFFLNILFKQFIPKLLTQSIKILFSSTQTPIFLAIKQGESKG